MKKIILLSALAVSVAVIGLNAQNTPTVGPTRADLPRITSFTGYPTNVILNTTSNVNIRLPLPLGPVAPTNFTFWVKGVTTNTVGVSGSVLCNLNFSPDGVTYTTDNPVKCNLVFNGTNAVCTSTNLTGRPFDSAFVELTSFVVTGTNSFRPSKVFLTQQVSRQ